MPAMKLSAALSLALFALQLHAQQFDVASVKANKSNDQPYANMPLGPGAVYTPTGGFFDAKGLPLVTFIAFAWKMGGVDIQRLVPQLPQWVLTDRFDIQARAEGNPSKDTFRLMMRSLLADRFKLALRSEKQEIPVSAFVLSTPGKLGPQLRLHTEGGDCPRNSDPAAPPPTSVDTVAGGFPVMCGGIFPLPPEHPGDQRIAARDITLEFLARSLPPNETNRPLVDHTGLKGTIDFVLEWLPARTGPAAPAAAEPDPDQSGPTFEQALAKQLGIKLESTKALMDVLVLDHIEHLTEN
jgi:uncharacterized protein (TIGR03435 family)